MRVRVDIKWDDETQSFHAFKIGTNQKIKKYHSLIYGNVDSNRDDIAESSKTFQNRGVDNRPNKTIKLKGWATVS